MQTEILEGSALRRELGWLSDDQVCAITGWSHPTLRNRRSAGTAPPSSKVGKHHLTKITDFEAWLRRRRVHKAVA